MNTLTNTVEQFVSQVREQLTDLSTDDLQSLTENLAEDLRERLTDEGSNFELGDPVAYAAELRAAAGLNVSTTTPTNDNKLARLAKRTLRSMWESIRSVRAIWWVLRAFVVYSMLASDWNMGIVRILPDSTPAILLLAVLLAISVQLGNGKWNHRWLRYPLVAINIATLLASSVWFIRLDQIRTEYSNAIAMMQADGLIWHGQWVNEVKALDSAGQPLPVVTLIDQWGNLIYRAPQPLKVDALNQIVGMTQEKAIQWLSSKGYNAVDFRYETVLGFEPGVVTSAGYQLNTNGLDYVVEVTVSQ